MIINFRDLNYLVENGGFYFVEICLEKCNNVWYFCYVMDFVYIGNGFYVELVKDFDFDFDVGVF